MENSRAAIVNSFFIQSWVEWINPGKGKVQSVLLQVFDADPVSVHRQLIITSTERIGRMVD